MGQTPVLRSPGDKYLSSTTAALAVGPGPLISLLISHRGFSFTRPLGYHKSVKSKPSNLRFISICCVSRARGPATLTVPCVTKQDGWLPKCSAPWQTTAWLWDSWMQILTDHSAPLSSDSALVHSVQINGKCTDYKVQIKNQEYPQFCFKFILCKPSGPFNHSPNKRELKSWKQSLTCHLVRVPYWDRTISKSLWMHGYKKMWHRLV